MTVIRPAVETRSLTGLKYALSGGRFGKLVVLKKEDVASLQKRRWICECDCGKRTLVHTADLLGGSTSSCGCLKSELVRNRMTKHGMRDSKLYDAWHQMKQRCSKPTHRDWKHYGGRGISVCQRWQDFTLFLVDMGERPNGMTLERIDVDGNYEPSNCRWATQKEQTRNTRRSQFVTYRGITKTISAWAEDLGQNPATLRHRLQSPLWTTEEAFTLPVNARPRHAKGTGNV
jgi:hypothetical protein